VKSYFEKELEQKAEKEKQDAIRRKNECSELRNILATKSGRAVIWRIMKRGNAFDGSYEPSRNAHYFKSGQRNQALWLLDEVLAASPDAYHQMRKENGGKE
jgi:hypothetical protein